MIKWFLLFAIPLVAEARYFPTSQTHCQSIDLRNDTLSEVRNQGDVSWCYAFTAADMLAHTFNIHDKLSAADIAINYNNSAVGKFSYWLRRKIIDRKDEEVQMKAHVTGFNKIALKRAMKAGHCSEEIFPSEVWTKMVKDSEGSWKEEKVLLLEAMLEIAELHKKRASLTPENLPFYYSFKNVGPETFIDILKSKSITKIYASLRNTVCADDRIKFDDRYKVKMVFKNRKIFRRIASQLDQGRLVGIDYDSRILRSQEHRGVNVRRLHTSSIVGRRWNRDRQSCEFLVRDSYGKNCEGRYDSRYECEDGNIWMDEEFLYPNMTSIVYINGPTSQD